MLTRQNKTHRQRKANIKKRRIFCSAFNAVFFIYYMFAKADLCQVDIRFLRRAEGNQALHLLFILWLNSGRLTQTPISSWTIQHTVLFMGCVRMKAFYKCSVLRDATNHTSHKKTLGVEAYIYTLCSADSHCSVRRVGAAVNFLRNSSDEECRWNRSNIMVNHYKILMMTF